jgi:hypothetical protein
MTAPSRLFALPVSALVLLASGEALASGWFDPPTSAPPPAATPPGPPAAADEGQAEDGSSPCRLGDHAGIPLADATTAAELVCAEIARLGPPVDSRYRVSLGRLGSIVVLSATREEGGKVKDFRQMRLSGIEDVSAAAPRMARSLVAVDAPAVEAPKPSPTPEVVRPQPDVAVVEEHAPTAPKGKPGSLHFAAGLIGLFAPLDQGASVTPGLDLDLHHETGDGRWELGGALRFGASGGGTNSTSIGFFNLATGAKFFTSEGGDVSPYLGGGLTWSYWNLSDAAFHGDGNGLGAYLDAGFQLMRTHHAHIAIGARLDLPFFSLNDNAVPENFSCLNNVINCGLPTYPSRYYYAPLSLELRVTF